MPLDKPHHPCVEAAQPRAIEFAGKRPARGLTLAPQEMGLNRATEAAPHPVQRLVGGIGRDTQLFSDLSGFEPVPEVQIEDARITLPQCGGCDPHEIVYFRSLGLSFRVTERTRGITSIEHPVVIGRLHPSLVSEPVEGAVT